MRDDSSPTASTAPSDEGPARKKLRKLKAEPSALHRLPPGRVWDMDKDPFPGRVADVRAFVEAHGEYPHWRGSRRGEKQLASWVSNRRFEHKKGRLEGDKVAQLEALPAWEWEPADPFASKLEGLKAFLGRHGEFPRLSRRRDREGERELGTWISKKRQEHKRGRLSAARAAELEALPGWVWEGAFAEEDPFPRRLADLKAFIERHGEYPTLRGRGEGEKELGKWIHNRRQDHKRGKLLPERAAALEALRGWKWEGQFDKAAGEGKGRKRRRRENMFIVFLQEEAFMNRVEDLRAFLAAHARYPKHNGPDVDERGLAKWIYNRRQDWKTGKLSAERIQALGEVEGWKWEAREK